MATDLKARLEADGYTNVVVETTPTRLKVTMAGGPLGQVKIGDGPGGPIMRNATAVHELDLDEDMTLELATEAIMRGAEGTLLNQLVETHQPKYGTESLYRKVVARFAHRPGDHSNLKQRAHVLAHQRVGKEGGIDMPRLG